MVTTAPTFRTGGEESGDLEAESMRYRRLSYRYALTMTANRPGPVGGRGSGEPSGVRLAETFWRPSTDVCVSPHAVDVTVELAGIDQDALDVLLFDDALVIEGQRRMPPAKDGVYHVAEIRQGPFRLELPLPEAIDLERVNARYDRGLLQITIPKRQNQESAKTR
jgi:HSP20 family protein